jgi:hypothetical protein
VELAEGQDLGIGRIQQVKAARLGRHDQIGAVVVPFGDHRAGPQRSI